MQIVARQKREEAEIRQRAGQFYGAKGRAPVSYTHLVAVFDGGGNVGICGFLDALQYGEQPTQHIGQIRTIFSESHVENLLWENFVSAAQVISLEDGSAPARDFLFGADA